jgi:hypothetical protein
MGQLRLSLSLAILTTYLVFLASCARPPQESASSQEASNSARVAAIPAADTAKYRTMKDMRAWRNPYLIIRADGVGVLDSANHVQRLIKPEELPQTLAQLPASSWPYGRVVAVAENAMTVSADDKIKMRKNRALVAGTLESMQVLITWVPSA